MFKHKNKIICVLVAAAFMSCFTGCAKETADNGKTKVRMWAKITADSTPDEIEAHEKKMAALEERFPNYEFDVVKISAGTDYRQEYDKALMAGTAPDFFEEFSYTDIPTRIQNKTIADITELVEGWDLKKEDKVLDTFDGAISKDGKWYAVPRSAYVQGTFCNKKAIIAGGGDINNLPKTWKEFSEVGAKITDMSVPRIGYELVGMDWCAWPYTAWVWSAGGEMVRPNGDGTYQIAFNEEPGIDAAMFMNEMIWKYKMTQKNILVSYEDIIKDIRNNTACFSWASFNNLSKETLKTYGNTYHDYTAIPMPVKDESIPRPSLAGGEVIVFNPKASKETLKAAFEVVNFLYYDEEYLTQDWKNRDEKKMLDVTIPARKDMYEKKLSMMSLIDDETKDSIRIMSENAIAEPFCGNWGDLKSKLVNPLQEIFLTEGITREKTKELLDQCAEELYKLYPESFRK